MECIKKIRCGQYSLIGINDFIDCQTPDGVLFINDLPGMTLKKASAISNDEYRTGIDFLKQKIRLAHEKIFHEFPNIVSDHFTFNSYISQVMLDKFSINYLPQENINRGLRIRKGNFNVAKVFIEELYIKTVESGVLEIIIQDGDDQHLYEVSILADKVNAVEINYKCKSDDILITFNNNNFSVYTGRINRGYESSCRPCKRQTQNEGFIIHGWDGESETDEIYGLGVCATLQCDEETLYCRLLPRMNFMIWYRAGIDIMEEQLNSTRVNPIIVFGREQAALNIENWSKELAEEKKQFTKNIHKFLKSTAGECFTCKGNLSSYAIP